MADIDVLQSVGDADDRLLIGSQPGKELHHFLVGPCVKTAGYFIQEQDCGIGDEFHGQTDTLELSTAQRRWCINGAVSLVAQPHLSKHPLDVAVDFPGRGVPRQAQARGILESPLQEDSAVYDVLLRNIANGAAKRIECPIKIGAIIEHLRELAGRRPFKASRRVDFPDPLLPKTAVNSPGLKTRSMLSKSRLGFPVARSRTVLVSPRVPPGRDLPYPQVPGLPR